MLPLQCSFPDSLLLIQELLIQALIPIWQPYVCYVGSGVAKYSPTHLTQGEIQNPSTLLTLKVALVQYNYCITKYQ